MYINPEKYVVMAQTHRFGNVQQYFLSKRSILKGEHCYQYMTDNIDEALIFRDSDEAFDALYMLYPWWFNVSGVYRVEYGFKGVND